MNKQILRLAIPNILSNLSIPLLSLVDTALMGHLEGVHFLGAIAIGSTIFNFIYWGFGFLRMGTTGLTAQAFGKNDYRESILIFSRALIVVIAAAAFLLVLQTPIAWLCFYLFDASAEVETFARSYYDIRIGAAPATLALYAFHGWFLGMQNANYPLILTVAVNVLNIIFSYLLVFVFHLNSDGVALGTVLAQYIGLLIAVYLFFQKYTLIEFRLIKKSVLNPKPFKNFLAINSDIFIRTLCLVFVFTYFTAESATFGDVILAANAILFQLWMVLAHFIDGLAFAAESLVGKFIGAKQKKALKKAIRYLFLWTTVVGIAFTAGYYLYPTEIIRIFTNNPEIIDTALLFIGWTISAPLVCGICFIWDGVFIGATDSKSMRNSMLFCTLIVFLPTYFFTQGAFENHALWLAMTMFMLFRGFTMTYYAYKRIPLWLSR